MGTKGFTPSYKPHTGTSVLGPGGSILLHLEKKLKKEPDSSERGRDRRTDLSWEHLSKERSLQAAATPVLGGSTSLRELFTLLFGGLFVRPFARALDWVGE